MTEIRKARIDDLPAIMEIFREARGIMRNSGNRNQWNDGYPSEDIVRNDIMSGYCIMLTEEGRITATMAFIPGPEPTYSYIHDGEWPDEQPYYVIHRIAARETGHGVFVKLMDWAFRQLEKPVCTIRIDTHRDNIIMRHLLNKYGFRHCGIIHLMNGDPRDAYIKTDTSL